MYIAIKDTKIIGINEVEWECRREAKGLDTPSYMTWLESVTSGDPPVADYSGETGYTIVKCTDEDVQARLAQLSDYVLYGIYETVYNITWSDSKDTFLMTTDMDGKSVKVVESVEPEELDEDPDSDTFGDVIKEEKTNYKMSHFSGDDTTKDARLLADKWVNVRRDRDRKLAETDFHALSDSTLATNMKTYRQALRDVPEDNADPDDISWPEKP